LVFWTAAGLNYSQRKAAQMMYEREKYIESNKDAALELLASRNVDKEIVQLKLMYGEFKSEQLFVDQLPGYFGSVALKLNVQRQPDAKTALSEIEKMVVNRCRQNIPNLKRIAHLLDEEQEKELEQEQEEERQVSRPGAAEPRDHVIDENVVRFLSTGRFVNRSGMLSLPEVFRRTKLWPVVEPELSAWGKCIYATLDFANVVKSDDSLDDEDQFLRPPAWFAAGRNDEGSVLLLLSPFEVNHFLPLFQSGLKTTLHMYAPTINRNQSNLANDFRLQLPVRLESTGLDCELLVPLFAFSGCLYFDCEKEQRALLNFLGVIPRPRSKEQNEAFDRGWILRNGFVKPKFRRELSLDVYMTCMFVKHPVDLVKTIAEMRNDYFPLTSHLATVLIDCRKVEFEEGTQTH